MLSGTPPRDLWDQRADLGPRNLPRVLTYSRWRASGYSLSVIATPEQAVEGFSIAHVSGYPFQGSQGIYRWLSRHRRGVALVTYAAVAAVSYLLALLFRFDLTWPEPYGRLFLLTLPWLVAVRTGCAWAFRLAALRWRFVGTRDVLSLILAVGAGSAVIFTLMAFGLVPRMPTSVLGIEALFTSYFTAGVWVTYRAAFERLRRRRLGSDGPDRRALIIGAGEAGNMLAHEMNRFPTGYRPIGFIDDDPVKRGSSVQGVRVLGGSRDLAGIASATRADEVIIAVPSAEPGDVRRLVTLCEELDTPFKILPGIKEVLAGDVSLTQLREVRIEDLLGREPIQLELPELAADLEGQAVLITGAAGSIGSELARQVALHQPGCLVLLDQAETELFYLELELRERHPDLTIAAVVGDVVRSATIEYVFRQYAPSRVFHAAAYKHVPMMEVNAAEALRNNVIGTWRVASAAGRHGTERFVLVSTDKAVRPSSVMGATKRLAELATLDLQRCHPDTAFAAVRFGNVLGSNGSVIPIFMRQLEEGRPLTVTHAEATRYFMTIPEAVQLILQASLLPELRGRIAMLEMGEPVRIVDLARNLIRLSASRLNTDQGIVYTGLRPGEKLHEELVAPDEDTMDTLIPKVRLVVPGPHTQVDIRSSIEYWEHADAEGERDAMLGRLLELFPALRTRSHTNSVVAASSGVEMAEAITAAKRNG